MVLSWLPIREDWDSRLLAAKSLAAESLAITLRELATSRMEVSQLSKLDRVFTRALSANGGELAGLGSIRLAILGSATTSHLPSGIRVAGLRHGLAIEIYEAPYGMYWQELMDTSSGLYSFQPDVILLALDARHLAGAQGATSEAAIDLMRSCWRQARSRFSCQILQQTLLPVFPRLMGNNESRMTHSSAAIVDQINQSLRPESESEGVDLLALDTFSAVEGITAWHEPGIWHRSKHEVHPRATQLYGDQVARLIASAQGRSAKCLVLDLDNTLWGGVIGDDGLEGIVLGQGNGVGEAFVDFQRYAKGLTDRGVILAVCSKNDEKNALDPFERHPEMVLKRDHIACFVANWNDKASNLRSIAKTLNIGIDSLVFADDNPVERALIRQELPLVRVPEMPEDPAAYISTISAAGYFEGLRVTDEDKVRSQLYQQNSERTRLMESATDMEGYLHSLRMEMSALPFDNIGLARITQLINKTNQFNLMTERLSEAEVAKRMQDPNFITLQVRLTDRFGDNGIIAILIAAIRGAEADIETWLMSCRVLGRRVEEACLEVMAERCREAGVQRLIGRFRRTEKNGMVKDLYSRLGFTLLAEEPDGNSSWLFDLSVFEPTPVPMKINTLSGVTV